MWKNTKSLLKHPPFVSQQTELLLLLLHLRSSSFETKPYHSGLKSVNDSSFDSCSLKAAHSSLDLHWKPSSHSPAKLFSHFHSRSLVFDLDLQQTPFSTPSHFMSVNCEAKFCHSWVNEVMASSFASSSWKKGLIETGNRNLVHFRNFLT